MEKILEKVTGLKGVSVAVTVATGFNGRHRVKRLLDEGVRLEIITRDRRGVPSDWEGRSSMTERDVE